MVSANPDEVVAFGPFRLNFPRRKLYCGDREVPVRDRAMDVLLALARQKGEVVSKEKLFAAAWPDVFVEDANLKVTVAYLRGALRTHAPAADYINTIVGRGYWLDVDAPAPAFGEALQLPHDAALLSSVDDIVGRDREIADIRSALNEHRLVTIVGAGGMGKTTVARATARLVGQGGCPVTFVDFSGITNEDYVASSLASALGISSGGDSLQAIVAILAARKMLLVLDTCEHVLSAVTHICEVALGNTRNVRILATSRQSTRARGEMAFRLSPLAVPSSDHLNDANDVLRFSAPQLLEKRAAQKGYRITDSDARPIAEICRRLDGSPLAIELISMRLADSGAAALVEEFDARFLTFERDGGEGPSRQRTLLMTLQWSYALLTDQERQLLRALSIFAGSFDADSAVRVAACDNLPAVDIIDAIAGLRAKSMLGANQSSGEVRYRLLDSTRAFSAALLDRHAETAEIADRHAQLQLELLMAAASRQGTMPAQQWRTVSARLIDELRKALDWTLFRSANPLLGIELVAAALPILHDLSLGEETRANCERALAEFERIGCNERSVELKLLVGLARVSTYVSADGAKTVSLFKKAARLARELGDPAAECRVLGALATYELLPGRGGAVFETLDAMRQAALRTGDVAARWEEEQLRAQWEIRTCDFESALGRVEGLFAAMREDAESGAPRFQIHQKMNVEVQLAALNWLNGRPGEAVRVAVAAADDAERTAHGMTLIHCLAQGIVWTLFQCGEYEGVRPYVEKLRGAIYRHGMAAWIPVADCYEVAGAAMAGERPDPETLRKAYATVRDGMVQLRHDARFAMFAEAMLANGQVDDAAQVIRDVFKISDAPWGKSEFLRMRAATERAVCRDAEARVTLEESLRFAASIGCPAWELRSAHDLALLLGERGARSEAGRILAPVYSRFGDEFETTDLGKARRLLAELS